MNWLDKIFRTIIDFMESSSNGKVTPTPTPMPSPTPIPLPPKLVDYLGQERAKKFIEEQLPILEAAAKKEDTPLGVLLAQYNRESTFGTNPNINRENSATALGPLQIKRNWATPQYPAFKDLYIKPEDRLDLGKAADFAAKHYRYLTDFYGSPDVALSSYGGSPNYAAEIMKSVKSPLINEILDYVKNSEERR